MADSVKNLLARSHVLNHVVVTGDVDRLLSALEVTGPTQDHGGGITTGAVSLVNDLSKSPLPGFDFALTLPARGFDPVQAEARAGHEPDVVQVLAAAGARRPCPGGLHVHQGRAGIRADRREPQVGADGSVRSNRCPPADPRSRPCLVSGAAEAGRGAGACVAGVRDAAAPASMRFTPDTDSTEGVVALGLEPRPWCSARSRIGFDCPALIIDDSEDGQGARRRVRPRSTRRWPTIAADTPAWRGILARELDFYLPADVPLFGGQPIKGYFAIPHRPRRGRAGRRDQGPGAPAAGRARAARVFDPHRVHRSDGERAVRAGADADLGEHGAAARRRQGRLRQIGGGDRSDHLRGRQAGRATATFARDPVNAAGQVQDRHRRRRARARRAGFGHLDRDGRRQDLQHRGRAGHRADRRQGRRAQGQGRRMAPGWCCTACWRRARRCRRCSPTTAISCCTASRSSRAGTARRSAARSC